MLGECLSFINTWSYQLHLFHLFFWLGGIKEVANDVVGGAHWVLESKLLPPPIVRDSSRPCANIM